MKIVGVAKRRLTVYNSNMTDENRQAINRLIENLAQGDISSLDALCCLVSGRLLSVALSVVGNRTLAEDVVQESFVKVVQNARAFKRGTNGYAWLCKIVQNTALNTLRSERRRQTENIDDFFDIACSENVSENCLSALAVKKGFSVLTKEEKTVIYQKYFMDFTVREIARSLGKSKSAVQRLIDKAENKMKVALSDR